jgi:hypothetical protein
MDTTSKLTRRKNLQSDYDSDTVGAQVGFRSPAQGTIATFFFHSLAMSMRIKQDHHTSASLTQRKSYIT